MTLSIRGSGGTGGGGKGGSGSSPRIPTETADSLQSVQYGEVLDLISEGEIGGLEAGEKSIYFDDVPLENLDGTKNFSGYTVETRTGTQAQPYIPTLGGAVQSEKGVSVRLFANAPIVRTITNINVNRVRITVAVPALQIVQDNGDITGFAVDVQVEVQYNGGGYSYVLGNQIIGKTSTRYQRDFIIPLVGAFPVDIRVSRINYPDETSPKRQNELWWASYTEIIDQKLRYPNSALVGLRFDARQFNNIPQRKYKIRGIKVRIPSNGTVDTTTHKGRITYAGVWNGTFGAAQWTADPAWCLYDLLTNTRYGAGIPEASLDKYDFYAISQHCNTLVSDGRGGQEPRFTCNMVMNTRQEVYNTIQEMISIFRGIAYYGAGSFVLLQDRPSDSQYLLGPSNVIDGIFSYSGTSQKARHSTATVAWQSYATLGEPEYEYVEDTESVAKYGIINKEVKAIGCYSQSQAQRLGRWLLLSERYLTESVSFSVGIDSGIVLRPGVVIDIADPTKSGSRRSGRVTAATTTTITVDNSTGLSTANSPTISVLLPTGLVEKRAVTSIAGSLINIAAPLSQAPAAGSVWLVETTNIQAQQFRVLTVSEGSEDGIYAVTALEYNSTIYDAIELGTEVIERDISDLTEPPEAPYDPVITEYLYESAQTVRAAVNISWQHTMERVADFRVSYRIDQDNWTNISTLDKTITIQDTRPGTLQVEIRALNFVNRSSPAALGTLILLGKTAPPGDVQNLSFEAISLNSGRLRWNPTVDLDVRVGGRVIIRHSAKTDGSGSWANSIDLIEAIAGYNTEVVIPLLEGEVLVKFEDDGGRQSLNETSVLIDLPDAVAPLGIIDRRESADVPPFQGQKNNVFYDDIANALTLEYAQLFDSISDIDTLHNFDNLTILDGDGDDTLLFDSDVFADTYPLMFSETTAAEVPAVGDNAVVSLGTYDFLNLLDLENVYSVDLSRYFITRANYLSDQIDSRFNLVDDWPDWDGLIASKVNARLLVSHTNRNHNGTYSQSGTTVTIPVNDHGYVAGDSIEVNFTSGSGTEGAYIVATASSNSLTYTAPESQTTSGNVKLIGGGTWTAFQDLAAGTYRGMAFRFRAQLESNAIDQNILVDELGYGATLQIRIENSFGNITSSAGATNVTFNHAFFTGTASLGGINAYKPSVGITANNMGSGEYFEVTNVSGTGFTVTFRNAGGTAISRTFGWIAVGYGKGG